MANILSRNAILAARLRHEDVEVPELGGVVRVWELSALRKLDFMPGEGETREAAMVRLVAACIGDESGPLDIPPASVSSSVVMRLTPVVMRINVASKEAKEEMRGNSSGEPTGSSPTGSP